MKDNRWIGAAAVVAPVVVLLVVVIAGRQTDIEDLIPDVNLSASEAQVRERIAAAVDQLREDPSSTRWGRLGQLFHAHEFLAPAVACYREAGTLDPEDYRWPYLAALAQAKLDLPAARGLFEAAARRDPPNASFYVNYGDLVAQLGDMDAAAEKYRAALALQEDAVHALLGLARVALSADDIENAQAYLDQMGQVGPGQAEVHEIAARLYARSGDQEAARRAEQLARAAPTTTRPVDPPVAAMEALAVSSTAFARRGQQLTRAGDYEAAEEVFRRVLKIRAGHAGDHANLGVALARQGRLKLAIEQFRRGLGLAPDDVDLLNNLGMTLADAGELESGAEYLNRALAVDVSFREAHENLGLVRERQGRLEDAVGHYREALRLNPQVAEAQINLGSALAKLGRAEEAIAAWEAALGADPEALAARYNLSVMLVRVGRHKEALAQLRAGIERAPRSSRFLSLLAWELATAPDAELRDGPRALALARRLFEASPSPAGADLLAAALAENGRFEEAAATAQSALQGIAAGHPQAMQIKQRLALYRQGLPYHQAATDIDYSASE